MRKICLNLIGLIAVIVTLAGCGGSLTSPGTPDSYQVSALLVKEMATDSARVEVTLKKNGVLYSEAYLTLRGLVLTGDSTGYRRTFTPAQISADTSYTLNIKDSSFLNVNLTISLPDTLSITNPDFRYFTGGVVPVQWIGGTSGDGYILATAPPAAAPDSADGYSTYTLSNSGNIPTTAFMYNATDRIVGNHHIYVASYIGAPVAAPALPFDLPNSGAPAANVAVGKVTGRLAGVILSPPDSINVAN